MIWYRAKASRNPILFERVHEPIGFINRLKFCGIKIPHPNRTQKVLLYFLGTLNISSVIRTITNSITSSQSTLIDGCSSLHLSKTVMYRKQKSKCTSITSDVKKKRRSLKKAPGAPKRFKSSYIHFFTSVRGEIAKELESSAGVSVKNLNVVMYIFQY